LACSGLVERVPWERVLKVKGVQEGWTFFKEEVWKAWGKAVPMCRKTNWHGWLDLMILEVFSNLNGSMILKKR